MDVLPNKVFVSINKSPDAINPEMKFEFKSVNEIYLHVFLYELAIKNDRILTKINKANMV